MGLSSFQKTPAEVAKPATHGRRINYSVERLQKDERSRVHIRRELALIKEQYGIKDCTVVEVGCGLGSNLEVFQADNQVIGIEGLEDAVAEARRRGLRVQHGDLELSLSVASDTTDWVFCLDVLEHLLSPMKLMFEIRRVLHRRGKIVINVPNHFDLIGRIRLLAGHDLDVHNFFPGSHEWDNPHVRFFTHRGIKQLLNAAGFRMIEDRSPRFWSFPKGRILKRVGLKAVLQALALHRPSVFAAGFLLVGEKQ